MKYELNFVIWLRIEINQSAGEHLGGFILVLKNTSVATSQNKILVR